MVGTGKFTRAAFFRSTFFGMKIVRRCSNWVECGMVTMQSRVMVKFLAFPHSSSHQWRTSVVKYGVSQVKPSNCLKHLEKLVLPSIFVTSLSSSVAYLRGPLCEGPPWPDRRDFCNYFGIIFSAVWRQNCCHQWPCRCVFWPENALKCVCGRGSAPDPAGGAYSAPPALPTCLLLTHVALCQRVRGVVTRTHYINVLTYLHQ